jgi:hypothetical protein
VNIFTKKPAQGQVLSRPAGAAPAVKAKNNYLLIILDSCRFDSMVEANPVNILRLGTLERRYSYASWTAPSHYNLLIGLMPHSSPANVYASDYYKHDFLKFNERFGVTGF